MQLINVTDGVGVLIKLDYSPLNYPPVMLIDQGTPNPQVPSVLRTLGWKLQQDLSDNKKSKHRFLYLYGQQHTLFIVWICHAYFPE